MRQLFMAFLSYRKKIFLIAKLLAEIEIFKTKQQRLPIELLLSYFQISKPSFDDGKKWIFWLTYLNNLKIMILKHIIK